MSCPWALYVVNIRKIKYLKNYLSYKIKGNFWDILFFTIFLKLPRWEIVPSVYPFNFLRSFFYIKNCSYLVFKTREPSLPYYFPIRETEAIVLKLSPNLNYSFHSENSWIHRFTLPMYFFFCTLLQNGGDQDFLDEQFLYYIWIAMISLGKSFQVISLTGIQSCNSEFSKCETGDKPLHANYNTN